MVYLVAQIFCARKNCLWTVSDNGGLPLPGVSVLIKGTQTGVKLILMGNFPLKHLLLKS
jgi:hypothetical protein